MTPTTDDVLSNLRGYPANLQWSNFQSVSHSRREPFQAQTASGYSYNYRVEHAQGAYRVVGVRVAVTRGGAAMWAVTGASRTDDLLEHEQGHFDITGLIARDLCRDLMSIGYDDFLLDSMLAAGKTARSHQAYGFQTVSADVQKAIADAAALQIRLNGREVQGGAHVDGQYDIETNHSKNATGQQKWNTILQYARLNDTTLSLALQIFGR